MSSPSVSPEISVSPVHPARAGLPWVPAGITMLRWLLFAVAAWFFLWPAYRAFLNVEIDENEGWNAYFADAAMGRMPLYPSAEKLITNNYPPLSFYLVGGLGRLVGDPILAGRLLSLTAVLAIGAAVAVGIRALGGDKAGAGVGAAVFVITISRFSDRYVGMDDPQLLAQAIMAAGFAAFLRAEARNRSCLVPILLMGLAGFVKHNIIAMPLTAFLWLGFCRPKEAAKCALLSGIAVALGFGLCFALYGGDFFANMHGARQTSWARAFYHVGDLKSVNVPLAITLLLGGACWRDRGVRLCLLLTLVALGVFFLQRTGEGVDKNAMFDLMVAVSLGTGLGFSHAGRTPRWRLLPAGALPAAVLLAVCVRDVPTHNFGADRSFRLLFDPSFQAEIAIREAAMAATIARVRSTPGAVMCSNFVCYRAGKPFVIDKFNATQRMATGALPMKSIDALLATGRLTAVLPDPRADWDQPIGRKAATHGG